MKQFEIRIAPGAAFCVGVGCTGGPVRPLAAAGSRLCESCREALAGALAALPGLYHECGRVLSGGSERQRERISRGPKQGMPFNADAAEVRSAILGVLGSWSGLVADEQGLPAPRRSVVDLARFLRTYLDWLAAHCAAAEMSEEVLALVRSARRVAYPAEVRRMPIGSCVAPGCDGQLSAIVRPSEAPPAEITCDAVPAHTWPEHQWAQLRARMGTSGRHAAAPPALCWLECSHIARLWRVSPGSVYRLASEHRWRRRRRGGRTYYHQGDVQESFNVMTRAGQRK